MPTVEKVDQINNSEKRFKLVLSYPPTRNYQIWNLAILIDFR